MDRRQLLEQMRDWSPQEQLDFAQDVWDRIAITKSSPAVTEDVRSEIEARLNALDADPDDVVDWSAIVDHVRRKS
ncbi:MAG: addiction module protein [Planctomycetaceae bacterium]|nr:addiction module protein [Planctomycetaceae bacterium]